MTAAHEVLSLVQREMAWERMGDLRALLRTALAASALLGVLASLLAILPLMPWRPDAVRSIAFASLPLLAVIPAAATRHLDMARSAMRLDRSLGAGGLLVTAWDLARRGPSTAPERLVLEQAAKAHERWSMAWRSLRGNPRGPGLMPPLLAWLAVCAWLVIQSPATPVQTVAEPGHDSTAATAAVMAHDGSPPVGLAAAIADLESSVDPQPTVDAPGPPQIGQRIQSPGDANAPSAADSETTIATTPPAQSARPSGTPVTAIGAKDGHEGPPPTDLGATASSPGTGTRPDESPGATPVPLPPGIGPDWVSIPLERTGAALAHADGAADPLPTTGTRDPGSATAPTRPPPVPAQTQGRIQTPLRPGARAFIQRYHTELQRSQGS